MDTGNSLKSWQRMVEAAQFYESKGYLYHPVDWAVEEKYQRITFPGDLCSFVDDLSFVGSAEQSFIKDYDLLKPQTFYYAISPCVRLRDYNQSPIHRGYLKLELFYKGTDEENAQALEKILSDARDYFNKFSQTEMITKGTMEFDLEINHIEVGSYGIRKVDKYNFAYGTGVAEPRLSQALEGK